MKTRKLRLRGGLFGFTTKKDEPTKKTYSTEEIVQSLLAPVKIELEKELTRDTKIRFRKEYAMSSTYELYDLQQKNIKDAINRIDQSTTMNDLEEVKLILKRIIHNNICDTDWRRYIKSNPTSKQNEQQNKIKQLLQTLFSTNCNTPEDCAEIILQKVMDVIPNLSWNLRQAVYGVLKDFGVKNLESKLIKWFNDEPCHKYNKQNVVAQLFTNFGSDFNKEPDKSQVDEIIQFGQECYNKLSGGKICYNRGGRRKKRKTRKR
jgi:hypothetical protein